MIPIYIICTNTFLQISTTLEVFLFNLRTFNEIYFLTQEVSSRPTDFFMNHGIMEYEAATLHEYSY